MDTIADLSDSSPVSDSLEFTEWRSCPVYKRVNLAQSMLRPRVRVRDAYNNK